MVHYRETSKAELLIQATQDILEDDFKAKYLFIATFISGEQTFQMVLATDGETTYAVLNYEELNYEAAANVEVNELRCQKKRVFVKESDTLDFLFNGNSTGVKGRHVFKLTNPKCFKTILGLRTRREDITITQPLLSIHQHKLSNVIHLDEGGSVDFHLKETISEDTSIMNILIQSQHTTPQDFTSNYGVFTSTDKMDVKIQNLLVMKGTPQTGSLQYGNVTFRQLQSGVTCKEFFFKTQMNSTPAVKINANIENGNLVKLVNVWLKNVSPRGMRVCAKEMLDYSGVRDVLISFIAVTEKDENVKESSHLLVTPALSKPFECFNLAFDRSYIFPPSVFTSIETIVGSVDECVVGNTAVISWIQKVTATKVRVCVKPVSSTSPINPSKYKIHFIVEGDLSSCDSYKCPSHLEC